MRYLKFVGEEFIWFFTYNFLWLLLGEIKIG